MKNSNQTPGSDQPQQHAVPNPIEELRSQTQTELQRLRAENESLRRNVSRMEVTVAALKEQFEAFQKSTAAEINRQVVAEEYLDGDSERHIRRISRYSSLLAQRFGLKAEESAGLEYAAPLHDIGKSQISLGILIKPGKLSEIEFSEMKMHTILGSRLLSESPSFLLGKAREIALSHHENWNGSGYPINLKGKQIPLSGRIVRVIDAFDTLTSRRPHKMAYPMEVAFDMIYQERGKAFDPDIVECMQDNLDAFIRTKADIDTPTSLPHSDFAFSDRDRIVPSGLPKE